MKNKKGFTLIELLAVIAILALILVIATPNVIKAINSSRNNAYMTSFDNLLEDVKSKIIQKKTNNDLQVECAVREKVENRYSELPYCSEVYEIEESDHLFYVMEKEDLYYVFLEANGKFENVNLNEYKTYLSNKKIYLLNHNFEESNNSMMTVVTKNGKVLNINELNINE